MPLSDSVSNAHQHKNHTRSIAYNDKVKLSLLPIRRCRVSIGYSNSICNGLAAHLDVKNKPPKKIDNSQYGALRKKSTTHALVDMTHHWHSAVDKSQSVRIVFTCVGWQVILCGLIWQTTLRNSAMGFPLKLYTIFNLFGLPQTCK